MLAPLPPSYLRHRPPEAFHRYRGMNTSLTAYTPLETLLLFQSLASYGVEPAIFSRISDLLKKNPHINGEEDFDNSRLSPDALRELYLRLLKEEAKSEVQDAARGDSDGQNGEVKNPRKRKVPSPSLPTVQEASQHTYLIPKLVAKLYSRYRSYVTEQIREEERKYDGLTRELQEIERGEWDDKLRRLDLLNGKTPTLPDQTPSNDASQPAAKDAAMSTSSTTLAPDTQKITAPQQVSTNSGDKSPESRHGQAKIESVINHDFDTTPNGKPLILNPPTPHSTSQPTPGPGHQSPTHNRTPSQPFAPPKLPPPQFSGPGYKASPPTIHRSPYAQQPQPSPGPGPGPALSASPKSQNAAVQAHPPSPVLLPPPPGMQFPPTLPTPGFPGNGVPQYPGSPTGPPMQYSPTPQRYPGVPPGQQSPSVQHAPQLPQQQRSYYPPYSGHQPLYPPQPQQPQPIVHPPHQGGYMLPPFQVTPQDPTRAHQQQQKAAQQAPAVTPISDRAAPISPKPGGAVPSRPGHRALPSVKPPGQARTSISTPSSIRTPRPPLSLVTPSSETRWKPSALGIPDSPRRSPTVSPINDVAPFELPKAPVASSPTGEPRQKGKVQEPARKEDIAGDVDVRQMRSGRRPTKRRRGGSTASSVVGSSTRGRTRSQSVASHAETVSADNESTTGYRVKTEPDISADIIEEDATPADTTMIPAAAARRRGGTMQSLQSNKRKRNAREVSITESEDMPGTPGTQTVVAPRHFSRMSVPIMNDIWSHKHASIFSNPVKEKDAEGYHSIIKRPQDLKSIRTAISAGAKAVQAAAASDTPAGSPGGGGANVILPLSAEVVPPKAIVNSAQLEKELMRMFVNAVMFNSGEDGVVQDAKEMYETVQGSVSNWRSAERSTGRMGSEDLGGEDDTPTAGKRRKV